MTAIKFNHCKKEFSSKQRLQYHERRKVCQKVQESTVCNVCSKEFSTKQMLKYHKEKKVCAPKYKMAIICDVCSKEFSTKQRLSYHKDHEVCMKKLCNLCRADDDWHQIRCAALYNFEDIVCYEHGDLIERCCPQENIKKLVLRKKAIDERFCCFDVIEGCPWENQVYWQDTCKYCGCRRDGQHIWQCLAVKETPRSFKEYMGVVSKWRMSSEKDVRYAERFE